jgi:tetratricopeptide (TPR) repeat protein
MYLFFIFSLLPTVGVTQHRIKIEIDNAELQFYHIINGTKIGTVTDYKNIISVLNKAETFEYEDALTHVEKACCYFYLHNYSDAVIEVTKGINMIPNSDKFGDLRHAISILSEFRGTNDTLLQFLPDYLSIYDAYKLRALSKYNLEDYNGVLSDCKICLVIKNTDGQIYFIKGVSEYKYQGLINTSCDDLDKAGELGYKESYEMIKKICNVSR